MTRRAAEALENEIHRLLDYHFMEFKLTFVEIIGVLELVEQEVIAEALLVDEEEDIDG